MAHAVKVNIVVDTEALAQALGRAQEAVEAPLLMDAIGSDTQRWIDENFEESGAKVGGWQPLSPNTIAGRRKRSDQPLQDTGRLRASFVYTLEDGGLAVRVGTNLAYASYHEEGTAPYTIKPIPPNKVLGFMTAAGKIHVRSVNHPGIPQRRMLPNEEEGNVIAQTMIDARLRMIDDGAP